MKAAEDIKPLQQLLEASNFILSEPVKARFQESLKRFMIPKGRVLIDVGQVSQCLYFIEKGAMRTYYLRGSEDITSLLVSDGDIVCIAESFLLQKASSDVLETLEDTSGYSISYATYRKLVEEDVYMAGLAVKLLEQHLINFTDRVKVFKYLSVEQRIAHYIKQPSSLFRRIPDHYIATYLGTTAATFSRCLKTVNMEKNTGANCP
ncbi:Crp/Fnr family transcriptional regulator [Dyadobacter sp. CY343]|uniref:Crp/Fnr family transcriptional regulator n=1 Tax=Dyadobacter sp. CY343 TaxID=2907299 RepID=UPI001F2E2C0C|nr:Crp/Fnr family transcriptional regulator [Dyadobacter sp. CY343]MCE7062397.1 Crp/Fnr family transcriptional regulator [Dyadobacter sp. CY343]